MRSMSSNNDDITRRSSGLVEPACDRSNNPNPNRRAVFCGVGIVLIVLIVNPGSCLHLTRLGLTCSKHLPGHLPYPYTVRRMSAACAPGSGVHALQRHQTGIGQPGEGLEKRIEYIP